MKRKRFFSSGEKLEARRKRLDPIAKAKGEKTEKELDEWWKIPRYKHGKITVDSHGFYRIPKPIIK